MVEIFCLFAKLLHQSDHNKTFKERIYRMDLLKKLLIGALIVLTLNLYLPRTVFAQQLQTKVDVPKHSPQSWSSPEIKITKEQHKKKGKKWVYILLGILVVGIAAGGGGGGGSSSGDSGDYNFSW